jgi:hypothetical protein
MIVAPALGARILGAGIGEENAFWVPPSISTAGWDKGGNAGGQRTWIAPEAGPAGFFFRDGHWAVPPALDPGNYHPCPVAPGWLGFKSSFTARPADGRELPVAITRRMRLEALPGAPDALRIRFQHELANTGASAIERCIGLWSIIQLPCEEKASVLFRMAPGATRTPGTAGAAAIPHPYFTELPADVLRGAGPTVQVLEVKGGRKYKVGVAAAASAGVVAFLGPARVPQAEGSWILTAQRFAVEPDGVYLDTPDDTGPAARRNGDAVQAYNDPGTGARAFCEIEAHAPAVEITPGGSQEVEIDILVARADRPRITDLLVRELGFDTGIGQALFR